MKTRAIRWCTPLFGCVRALGQVTLPQGAPLFLFFFCHQPNKDTRHGAPVWHPFAFLESAQYGRRNSKLLSQRPLFDFMKHAKAAQNFG